MIIETSRMFGESITAKSQDTQWVPLNTKDPYALRELDITRMRQVGSFLYRFNPMVTRVVRLIRDFTVGQGANIYAADERVAEILKDFWHNDYCDMDRIIRRMALDLSIFGCALLPVAVSEIDHDVIIGYSSPFVVRNVKPDPRNIILADKIILDNETTESLQVVKVDTDPASPTYGYRKGECFFIAINSAGEDLMGISDIMASADFADCLDQLIFSSLERMNEEMKWVWDITLEGASADTINDFVKKLEENPPKPGSFQVHNEAVTWKPQASGIHASNIREEANLIRDYALGGMGVPSYFFNDGATSRQAAEAAASPAYQTLSSRQEEIELFLRDICSFVIDQKVLAGKLPNDIDREFTVTFPKISMRDLQRIAGAMSRIVSSMAEASDKGWIADKIGSIVINGLVNQLGIGLPIAIEANAPTANAPAARECAPTA